MPALLPIALLFFAGDGGAAAAIDGGPPSAPDGGATVEPRPRLAEMPRLAIRGVNTREPVVALTFDACATLRQPNGFDRKVFDILAAERVPATLYLSGRWVQKHPTSAKLIAGAPFIELGNHSYSHPRLTLVRKQRLPWQIRSTNQILEKQLGRRPLSLRPPAGAWNLDVVRAAAKEGLPVVTWTVVSGDVGGHVPPARMVERVVEQTRPGAIIIFHINRREPFTKRALPGIISGLRSKGFRFVTVSELLALPDATLETAKPSRLGFHKRQKPRAEPGNEAAASRPDSPAPSPPSPPPSSLPSEGDAHANPSP
jgi:peptidoglycan-N-acetylglucosamine deacetylase